MNLESDGQSSTANYQRCKAGFIVLQNLFSLANGKKTHVEMEKFLIHISRSMNREFFNLIRAFT